MFEPISCPSGVNVTNVASWNESHERYKQNGPVAAAVVTEFNSHWHINLAKRRGTQ